MFYKVLFSRTKYVDKGKKIKLIVKISMFCIVVILCSSLMISCNQIKKKTRFYPEEYIYPDSSLGNGKTFVYKDVEDTTNLNFKDIKIINEDGKAYVIIKRYNQTSTLDSEKYNIDKELIESYIFVGGPLENKLKGAILQNEIVDDGSRLGKRIYNAEYKAYDDVITIKTEEYFIKDTVINWNGQNLGCIKIRSTTWFRLNNKNNPSVNTDNQRTSEVYFAKGIGLIRSQGGLKNGSRIMELVKIKDMTR